MKGSNVQDSPVPRDTGQSWQFKCAKDTVKAILPFQKHLRKVKDKLHGYKREPLKDRNTILDGLDLIDRLGDVSGLLILEVGTGWQPMIPILLSLAGANVYLTDLYPLMRPDTFQAALDSVRENRLIISERLDVPVSKVDYVTRDFNAEDMQYRLMELQLTYLAACDCRHLALESWSLDVVLSRAVLEHIPPEVIRDIFIEAGRLLKPGGRMLHLVDHSDHWSHRDHRINKVNFLRYSDWKFSLTRINPQNYQNRLRHSEYRTMLKACGFKVTDESVTIDEACLGSLATMKLASKFQGMDYRDLATTSSILMATTEVQPN